MPKIRFFYVMITRDHLGEFEPCIDTLICYVLQDLMRQSFMAIQNFVCNGLNIPPVEPLHRHFASDDWIVFPEDYIHMMELFRSVDCKKVVFCQNHFYILKHFPTKFLGKILALIMYWVVPRKYKNTSIKYLDCQLI